MQPAIFLCATSTSVTVCPAASAALRYSSAIQAVFPFARGEPCKMRMFIFAFLSIAFLCMRFLLYHKVGP